MTPKKVTTEGSLPQPSLPQPSLPQLCKAIGDCEICREHLPLGPNPVLRVSSSATILIAGQAPGIRVHQSSIPFNDPSGNRLRQWMGVDRETFYDSSRIAIVPMGFCYPGSAERGDLPPRPECARTWHPKLIPLLSNIKLTLAIGIYAQKYYLGNKRKKSLTETVANWQHYPARNDSTAPPKSTQQYLAQTEPMVPADVTARAG